LGEELDNVFDIGVSFSQKTAPRSENEAIPPFPLYGGE
jgi:hypothetical protein